MADRESHQVFLCCSSRRGALISAVVDLVSSRLEESGISCWSEHRKNEKKPEADQRAAIEQAIRSSALCVTVVDGRKDRMNPEQNWQIEEAIAHELPVVPFCLRKPGGDDSDRGEWLDDLDAVLDEDLGGLVRKVRLLLGAEEEAAGSGGSDESDEFDCLEFADGEATAENVPEKGAGDETEDEPVEAEAEDTVAEAPETSREVSGDETQGKISFPLPAPKLGMKGDAGRREESANPDGDDGEEEWSQRVDYPRRRKKMTFRKADVAAVTSEAVDSPGGDEEGSSGYRKVAPLFAAAVVIILLLIGIQVVSSRKSETDRERNMHELELLGYSLNMFAAANGGKLPGSIAELENLVNDGTALRWRDYEAHTEEEFIYYPGYSWSDSEWAVVAAAPYPDEERGRAVLYLNSDTRWMLEKAFQKRLSDGTIGPRKGAPEVEN